MRPVHEFHGTMVRETVGRYVLIWMVTMACLALVADWWLSKPADRTSKVEESVLIITEHKPGAESSPRPLPVR